MAIYAVPVDLSSFCLSGVPRRPRHIEVLYSRQRPYRFGPAHRWGSTARSRRPRSGDQRGSDS